MSALGPILERLEQTREQGYSVALLDRAVERALHVVQRVVDHAAETPKHLLSDDVMLLLERQVPEAAGVVRGLTRWSVQQRLDHSLNDVVTDVVLDLEHLLEDQDRAITMLRRMRNVLDQLGNLGAPPEEIEALRINCMRPEALPSVAVETRRLIRVALDDIYLEADQRDAGEAIGLEETARVLEELITHLETHLECWRQFSGFVAKAKANSASGGNGNHIFHRTSHRNTNRVSVAIDPQITAFKSILYGFGGTISAGRNKGCRQARKHFISKAWPRKHHNIMPWDH